jgi:hypothetical protein
VNAGRPEAPESGPDLIPIHIRQRFAEFLLDKRTGNLIIHVKSGKVLGGRLEEVLTKD